MRTPRTFRIEFGPLNINVSVGVTVKVESDAAKIQSIAGQLDASNEELKDAVAANQPKQP